MCESGVNKNQMKLAIAMLNDTLALAQEHLEELHHLADHGKAAGTSKELAQVTVMLGEARDKLETAVELLDEPTDNDVVIERL